MPILALAAVFFIVAIPAVSYLLEQSIPQRALGGGPLARVGSSYAEAAYLEQNVAPFNWAAYTQMVAAMWLSPSHRARGVALLNRDYPGKGAALASGMSLVESAVAGNVAALMQIQAISSGARNGQPEMQGPFQMLKVINEARKIKPTMAEQTFQDEVTRLALEPSESFEQSPYSMMKW